jgi:hypothetical protein
MMKAQNKKPIVFSNAWTRCVTDPKTKSSQRSCAGEALSASQAEIQIR